MTTMDLGNGVTSIGESAIGGKIESIYIPASVKNIEYGRYGVFSSWSTKSIIVDEANTEYSSDEYGVLFNKDKTVLIQYPIGSTRTEYTVPDGVETIAKNAFIYVKNLTSVKLPDTLMSIEKSDLLINFTILCNAGSYAESYAKENGIKFSMLPALESDETSKVESEEETTEDMTETVVEETTQIEHSEPAETMTEEIVVTEDATETVDEETTAIEDVTEKVVEEITEIELDETTETATEILRGTHSNPLEILSANLLWFVLILLLIVAFLLVLIALFTRS